MNYINDFDDTEWSYDLELWWQERLHQGLMDLSAELYPERTDNWAEYSEFMAELNRTFKTA